ncbi:MAG: hypothetical protein IPJ68_03620 [Candidatus Moraniibacteriota bacterium]|nr:MAG: hypothetical protein IPJ68_03620 [Candidatus Moranbacteria bacterium]
MYYLYHKVPKELEGNILYPLNQLETLLPRTFEKEKEKYRGREMLLQVKIPFLDCLWNDVLHLTAVPPVEIKKALIEAGRTPDFNMNCFQIDPAMLEAENTVIYLYTQNSLQDISEENNFRPYDATKISQYSEVPQKTRAYYEELLSEGKKPLLYHFIPHILYKGSIDTKNLERITV